MQIKGTLESKNYGYGLEVKPGWVITDHIWLSGLLGYGWSPYTLTSTYSYAITIATNNLEAVSSGSGTINKNFAGGHAITGVEFSYAINKHLVATLSYEYDIFFDSNLSQSSPMISSGDHLTVVGTNTIKVDSIKNRQTVLLGVNYLF